MFVLDFYCHVWVSSLQVHFLCDSSSLASCLQFQYLAQSGRWCLLGHPVWLTDDWTHISFCFTCIYICINDALSLASDTHPFASSLIISLCTLPKWEDWIPRYTHRWGILYAFRLPSRKVAPSALSLPAYETDCPRVAYGLPKDDHAIDFLSQWLGWYWDEH